MGNFKSKVGVSIEFAKYFENRYTVKRFRRCIMAQEGKRLSDLELLRNLVDGYLNSHYQISIEDLDLWYGMRFCKYITEINSENYDILDIAGSAAVSIEASLIANADEFGLDSIQFAPGDIVLDIGANVGLLSIYLAKKYPFLKIYAFEPLYTNCSSFITNVRDNAIPDNIITFERKAVTFDGKGVSMIVNPCNSKDYMIGDSMRKGYVLRPEDRFIPSTTFDDIFAELDLQKVKLLRIHCNGDEHEILKNCSLKNLKKIENLIGEFYESELRPDRNNEELIKHCKTYIKKVNIVERKS